MHLHIVSMETGTHNSRKVQKRSVIELPKHKSPANAQMWIQIDISHFNLILFERFLNLNLQTYKIEWIFLSALYISQVDIRGR